MERRLLVNWTDTMGVAPSDLRQTEDFFIELASSGMAARTEHYKFGLLPPVAGETESMDLNIKETVTGKLELCLRKIHAVTHGGYLIKYGAIAGEELSEKYLIEDKTGNVAGWDIVLSFNPYQRIPVGIPDEEELPLRHPDSDATFRIHILPMNEVNLMNLGGQQLIIGRVTKRGNAYVTEEYIPPCTYMCAHPQLVKYYNRFASMMEALERCSREIINKIRHKKNPSPLAVNIEMLCHQIMDYISTVYFHFNNAGLYWTPFGMAECFSTLAHKLYVSFCFISSADKEEMFTYFCEWGEINPGMLEACISDVLGLRYNHYHIRESMEQTEYFMTTLSQLWEILSQLEYIGQRKESIIVSDKKLQGDKTRKKWTFIGK